MNVFDALYVANRERLEWGRRTYEMGIINVTPDSFSGDGLANDVPAIADLALQFEMDGADILDLGAESTRPGHQQAIEQHHPGPWRTAQQKQAGKLTAHAYLPDRAGVAALCYNPRSARDLQAIADLGGVTHHYWSRPRN